MLYFSIDSKSQLDDVKKRIENASFLTQRASFLDEPNLTIYGYYASEEDDIIYIEFGKIQTQKTESSNVGVFALIKSYGSSKHYRGIMNQRGEVIVPNIYSTIELIQYGYGLFVVSKNGKYGLLNCKGEIFVPLKYELILDIGEVTLGIVENGLLGFADIEGNVIVKPKYLHQKREYTFENGVLNVESNIKDAGEQVFSFNVDHYGNIISVPEEVAEDVDNWDYDYTEHNLGTGYYPYGELPSSSDAYEGDESTRWNTD